MLSMHNVQNAQQAASYFSKDDYYLDGEQREPSSWWGKGAAKLGLSGAVERETFFDILRGKLPDGTQLPTGRPVGKGAIAPNGSEPTKESNDAGAIKATPKQRRAGLDLTFSAPKSVSLLALVGDHPDIAAAHESAVEAALTYLQGETALTRTMKNGVARTEATDNFVVARFSHDTSRKQDPQLHTHCVVMNMTQRADGQWRSLSNEKIYRSKMVAGTIYRSELAANLRRLGYEITQTHQDGRFEVGGFTAAQLEHFSQRRSEIEEGLKSSHVPNAKAAAKVALLTRESKRDVDRTKLGATWKARAKEAGIEFPTPDPARALGHEKILGNEADVALAYAVAHLSERVTGFEERDVLKHGLSHRLGRVQSDVLLAAIRRHADEGKLFHARRGDEAGPHSKEDKLYTTKQAVEAEIAIVDLMRAGKAACQPIMSTGDFRKMPAPGGLPLTQGQRDAISMILTSSDRVVGVQGYAGTGKSTLLNEVRRLASEQGYVVKGFAPTAVAANVLNESSGIESTTLARHFVQSQRTTNKRQAPAHGGGDPSRLLPATEPGSDRLLKGQPEIWIVDEMSMVGNRDALRLLRAANRCNARLVLLGDKQQLPSIEAGKVFSLLMSEGMRTVHMKQIVRQKQAGLRRAVEKTIERTPAASVEILKPALIEVKEDPERLQQVAGEFLKMSKEHREATFFVTPSRDDVRAITRLIRSGLQEREELSKEEMGTRVLVSADFTHAQTRESQYYVKGMIVRFRRAYKCNQPGSLMALRSA